MLKLLVFSTLVLCACAQSFYGGDCSGSEEYAKLTINSITNPITLHEGSIIDADFIVNINKMFPEKFNVHVSVQRKVGWLWIPVPCISNVGSCKYPLSCDMLEKMQQKSNDGKIEYQCPHPPGVISRKLTHKLPKIHPIVAKLGSGEYWLKITLYDSSDNKILACTSRYVNLRT